MPTILVFDHLGGHPSVHGDVNIMYEPNRHPPSQSLLMLPSFNVTLSISGGEDANEVVSRSGEHAAVLHAAYRAGAGAVGAPDAAGPATTLVAAACITPLRHAGMLEICLHGWGDHGMRQAGSLFFWAKG